MHAFRTCRSFGQNNRTGNISDSLPKFLAMLQHQVRRLNGSLPQPSRRANP